MKPLERCFVVPIEPTQWISCVRSAFGRLGVLLAWGVIAGCGYVSTSDYLNHIKTVTILPVKVEDPDFMMDASGNPRDETIREALIQRFNQKWRDGGDSQLDLIIRDYDHRPIEYNVNNQPERFRMLLELEYEFVDRVRNKVIDSKDNYVQIHDYYIVADRGEPPETREEAQAKLIQELVDDLYSSLAEQW
jgi:hypothetical protein